MMNDFTPILPLCPEPVMPFSFLVMSLVAGMMILLFCQFLHKKGVFRRILKRIGISVK